MCVFNKFLLVSLVTCMMFAIIGCSAVSPDAVTHIDPSQIEDILISFQEEGGKANGTLLVAEGENIVISGGFGIADGKSNQGNSVETQFLIGSITKQFTASALLKSLYDQERNLSPELPEKELLQKINALLHLPLHDHLSDEDPVWRGEAPSWLDTVTLHHLLCHTSGIPNYTADSSFSDFSKVDHNSISDVVDLFKNKDLEFTPGTKWNYSNSGYILLGIVVEKLNGVKIEDYFEEIFFSPLGMNSTFMPSHGRVSDFKKERHNLARGYAWDLFDADIPLKEQPMYENMLHAHAAGAIISTVEDLHHWNVALYEKEEVLPKFLLDLMIDKHALINPEASNVFYSYGLSTEHEPDLSFVGHHGGIPGYFSVLHYYPQQRITLVILQNVTGNAEQQVLLQEELQEKFGHLEANEERSRLEDTFLEEKYPVMFEQEKAYNFAKPIIDFFEKQ